MLHVKQLLLHPVAKSTKLRRQYRIRKAIDPGLAHRKEFLNEFTDNLGVEVEELESDFMNVDQSHKQYLKETRARREQLKYQIVKQKYFKEHYPNFLTWNEKEQIKYLYNTKPEEWTIDRLSESFPASPEIIKIIIKTNYIKSISKIAKHDKVVQENWECLKKGQFSNLPQHLVEHLKRFTDRSRHFVPLEVLNKKEVVNKTQTPSIFSGIVTSYEILKNKNKKDTVDTKEANANVQTFRLPESRPPTSKHHFSSITLKAFKNKLVIKHQEDNLLEHDKVILKGLSNSSSELKLITLAKEEVQDITEMNETIRSNTKLTSVNVEVLGLPKTKHKTSSGNSLAKKTEKDNHLIYLQRIRIPENKLKKGYTYKLNDCYYDYDGLFLYRVPGMD